MNNVDERYLNIMAKAHLYNEMLQALSKKTRLSEIGQSKIQRLQKEIDQLELEKAELVLAEVNPNMFLPSKNEQELENEILQKELEKRSEEKRIKILEDTFDNEIVNVQAVTEEVNSIIEKETEQLKVLEDEIYSTWHKFHELLDQYNTESNAIVHFQKIVDRKILSVKKDGEQGHTSNVTGVLNVPIDHNITIFLNRKAEENFKPHNFIDRWTR